MEEISSLVTGPAAAPASGGEKSPEKTPEEEETLVFYNVMPKTGESDMAIVSPKIKVLDPEVTASPAGSNAKVLFWVKIAGGAIILGLLAYGGYFVYGKLTKPAEEENLLQSGIKKPTNQQPAGYASPEWLKKYFGADTCADSKVCGPDADPDQDGLTNTEEYKLRTDPNNRDGDGDGLADGDEVKIFGSNPLDSKTAKDPKYTDTDFARGGYVMTSGDKKYSAKELSDILAKMNQYGLHQPTVSTLGVDVLSSVYGFTGQTPAASSTPSSVASTTPSTLDTSIDQSPEAKQERDAQRSTTMKNLSVALIRYQEDRKAFPVASSFEDMANQVKLYNRVATNPKDPINKDPYVYTYVVSDDKKDFTLTFYSETQNQVIKIKAADGKKYKTENEATQNDEQRKLDLDMIRSALLLYSNKNIAGNQEYVFPPQSKYKTALVPEYISSIPKDPKSGQDYEYQASETFDTFTIKAQLDAPPAGNTGYLCNQDECRFY